jgi:hypothetical protein
VMAAAAGAAARHNPSHSMTVADTEFGSMAKSVRSHLHIMMTRDLSGSGLTVTVSMQLELELDSGLSVTFNSRRRDFKFRVRHWQEFSSV